MPPKRKSDVTTSSATKRQRKEDDNAHVVTLVNNILADPDDFFIPEDDTELREYILSIAQYAQSLREKDSFSASSSTAATLVQKSPEELEIAVEKIRKAAVAGIKKQMNWRPTCKQSRAKWSYDGVCTDENVFATLVGLQVPLNFKQKRISRQDFETRMGRIRASARYSDLSLTGDWVYIRWSETGEFKLSGTYGI